MVSIGLRVYSDKKVFYTIIEETPEEYNFLTIAYISIPLALNAPERYNYVRNNLIDIISEYEVDNALLRIKEAVHLVHSDIPRFHIEGVLLESLAGSSVAKYHMGNISNMTRLLGFQKSEFKEYSEGDKDFENIPEDYNWQKLTKVERESILSALAALNL